MSQPSGKTYVCDLCGFTSPSGAGLSNHRGKKRCLEEQMRSQNANQAISQFHPCLIPQPGISNTHRPITQTVPCLIPVPTTSSSDQPINYPGPCLIAQLRRLRKSCKVLPRIPKAARQTYAEKLVSILSELNSKNDTPSWTNLLVFTYGALNMPDNPDKRVSQATIVKNNILHPSPVAPVTNIRPKRKLNDDKSQLRKAVERKFRDGNVSGAVRILSSDDTIAVPSPEVFAVLQTKHPGDNADAVYPDAPDPDQPLSDPVTADEIFQAVQSFPNGSAGGMDGMTPQHLKDLLCHSTGDIGSRLCAKLAETVNIMLAGKVPPDICPLLYGATLTALHKKDGGIRPIAVGNTLRRLAGKVMSHRVMTEMGTLVRPTQLGYGTKGGAEAVVHATRAFLSSERDCNVLLKIDFRNAFNTINRDKMLGAVRAHIPRFYPFVWQMYRTPSELLFGDFSLQSAAGVQQGDPVGPLLFCLVTHHLTTSLQSPLNAWFLDDGTVGGPAASVARDLVVVRAEGRKIGLELNPVKCEVFISGGDFSSRTAAERVMRTAITEASFPSGAELCLLGAPLLPGGIPAALDQKISTIKTLTDRLPGIQAHQALFILKNCLAAPKVLYVLRTSPAWTVTGKLTEFDNMIRSSLAKVTNTEMSDMVWRQASLPVRLGGLGIRQIAEIALPAYLASVFSVSAIMSTIHADAVAETITSEPVQRWCEISSKPVPVLRTVQKMWDLPLVETVHKELMTSSLLRERARLMAVSEKVSGSWLNALPSANLGLLLDDDSLRVAIALRLGAEVCVRHTCRCGKEVDSLGRHGLSCIRSAGRNARHTALNEVVRRGLVSAGIPAILEPPGLARDDGKRPDGMTMAPWDHGKPLVWDVTCVDTLAASHEADSLNAAGSAATEAEKLKCRKYADLEGRFIFSPIAVETLGPWGPATKDLLHKIGRKIQEKTGEKRSMEFFRQRISIEIIRGNAMSVLSTHVSARGLEEIFYVLNVKVKP